jgi:hypothetical protein
MTFSFLGKAAVNRRSPSARFQTHGKRGSAWSARALAPLLNVVAHREYQWLHECGKAFHNHRRAKAAEGCRSPELLPNAALLLNPVVFREFQLAKICVIRVKVLRLLCPCRPFRPLICQKLFFRTPLILLRPAIKQERIASRLCGVRMAVQKTVGQLLSIDRAP